MNWIEISLIAAGGAAVAGAAAFAGVKIRKKGGSKRQPNMAPEIAKSEFAAWADNFAGLYEPLYMMGKGSIRFRPGVMGDWATRTANLAGAENYKKMWNLKFSDYTGWNQEQGLTKINELLSFILAAGVCRDTADRIIVDGSTYKKYDTSDDKMIEAGNPARVKIPYWFIADKILEKGIIEKI